MIKSSNKQNNSKYEKIKIVENFEIPCRKGTYSFNRNTFTPNEKLLNGIITKKEYNKIIEEASKIMSKSTEKKRKSDTFENTKYTMMISAISLALVVFYLFGVFFAQNSKYGAEALLYISAISVVFGLSLTLALSIYNFFRKERIYIPLNQIIKDDLKNYFDNINNRLYYSIDHKYGYAGLLHFSYLDEKNSVLCIVEKFIDGYENKEPSMIEKSQINIQYIDGGDLESDSAYSGKIQGDDLLIGNSSSMDGTQNAIRKTMSPKKKTMVSGSQNISAKEIEIELNNTKSINS